MVLTRISLVIPLGMINVIQGTAQRYGASAAEHRANTKPKRTLRTERLHARGIPPVTGGQTTQAARNDRDTARNVRRSAAHKGLQSVRHPNARLHDLWRERGAVDRVEHVADERP
jgi:hypothetical protein